MKTKVRSSKFDPNAEPFFVPAMVFLRVTLLAHRRPLRDMLQFRLPREVEMAQDIAEKVRQAGVVAIIQPGGSKRDSEVIAAANAAKLPMVFTSRRHFRH